MNPGKALEALLLADPAVSALIKKRVYPLVMPETTPWPLITYQKISNMPVEILTGPATSKAPRYQVNCWADTHDAASELADVVGRALDGYVGFFGGVQFAIRQIGGQEIFDETSGLWNEMIDFSVRHGVAA
jgi:hypothetical protein